MSGADREAEARPDIECRAIVHVHARMYIVSYVHITHCVTHCGSFVLFFLFVRFYSRFTWQSGLECPEQVLELHFSQYHKIAIVAAQKLPSICARCGWESKLKCVCVYIYIYNISLGWHLNDTICCPVSAGGSYVEL